MALMTWDDKFSVGVKEIDAQHKKLVDMLNELHEAMKAGKGKDAMSQVLKNLVQYAGTHFATEEKYMTQFKFPDYAAHKAEHEKFVQQVVDFQTEYNSGKVALTLEVMNFLKEWLVKHIQGTDKKYGPFFNQHGLS